MGSPAPTQPSAQAERYPYAIVFLSDLKVRLFDQIADWRTVAADIRSGVTSGAPILALAVDPASGAYRVADSLVEPLFKA